MGVSLWGIWDDFKNLLPCTRVKLNMGCKGLSVCLKMPFGRELKLAPHSNQFLCEARLQREINSSSRGFLSLLKTQKENHGAGRGSVPASLKSPISSAEKTPKLMHPGECVYPPEERVCFFQESPSNPWVTNLIFFSMLDFFFFFAASKLNCFATGEILLFLF